MRRAALVLLGLLVAGCGGEGSGPPVRVTIPEGSSFGEVADSLAAREIIEVPLVFRLYGRFTGAATDVKPGVYAFRRGTAWPRILQDLRLGRTLTLRLTIPEGWTTRNIAARVGELLGTDPDSVLELLRDTALAAQLGVPGPSLEGYLYPATYTFPANVRVDSIVRRLVVEYQEVWTAERRARLDSLGLNEREAVTLASIIEREAKKPEEMPLISAVFHNRLRIRYPLQADPTVQYARGEHEARLLYEHIDDVADSPYNTYTHPGLPPGPIASPSRLAIDAALRPADVDYLYFVARADGTHVFTRSLDEHNRAKASIRRLRREAERGGAASPP